MLHFQFLVVSVKEKVFLKQIKQVMAKLYNNKSSDVLLKI